MRGAASESPRLLGAVLRQSHFVVSHCVFMTKDILFKTIEFIIWSASAVERSDERTRLKKKVLFNFCKMLAFMSVRRIKLSKDILNCIRK